MPETNKETLAQYVTRIIREKGLKHHEVKEGSGSGITDGYVRGIMTGKAANPSVRKLQALARGLGVSEDEIFNVARGCTLGEKGKAHADESNFRVVATLMLSSLKNAALMELLDEIVRLSPESRQEALNSLKYLNERDHRSSQPKKKR